jgi:glycosyltransferase involved in cell wall biosynthesis
MTITWFSWKDLRHPLAGGAERLGHEWRRRLVLDGHQVRHITARYAGSTERETLDGVETIRCGHTAVTHYAAALAHQAQHGSTDVIVEEVNTVPYFSRLLRPRAPTVLLYFQLAREIWFYQMVQPLSVLGYAAETVYTRLQAYGAPPVITISDDSKGDLAAFGFRPDRIQVVRVGIDNAPLPAYDASRKESLFTVLFHGSLRAMKRPLDALMAFHQSLGIGGTGQFWISGGGDDQPLRAYLRAHALEERVTFFGRISDAEKLSLMQRASVLVATSVKEGWGLIVTEANSMGTPAIVYDVDGLRSAAGQNNWISEARPDALAARLVAASRTFAERDAYADWCRRVLDDSRAFTHEASYADFKHALERTVRLKADPNLRRVQGDPPCGR